MARPNKNRKPLQREGNDEVRKKRMRPEAKSRPKHSKQWLLEADDETGFDDLPDSENDKQPDEVFEDKQN